QSPGAKAGSPDRPGQKHGTTGKRTGGYGRNQPPAAGVQPNRPSKPGSRPGPGQDPLEGHTHSGTLRRADRSEADQSRRSGQPQHGSGQTESDPSPEAGLPGSRQICGTDP